MDLRPIELDSHNRCCVCDYPRTPNNPLFGTGKTKSGPFFPLESHASSAIFSLFTTTEEAIL